VLRGGARQKCRFTDQRGGNRDLNGNHDKRTDVEPNFCRLEYRLAVLRSGVEAELDDALATRILLAGVSLRTSALAAAAFLAGRRAEQLARVQDLRVHAAGDHQQSQQDGGESMPW
jgi:hypothetical protein